RVPALRVRRDRRDHEPRAVGIGRSAPVASVPCKGRLAKARIPAAARRALRFARRRAVGDVEGHPDAHIMVPVH
ncbi:MAG: hypothetical protein V3U39_12440, partial [Acidimicrobiia bacterium]